LRREEGGVEKQNDTSFSSSGSMTLRAEAFELQANFLLGKSENVYNHCASCHLLWVERTSFFLLHKQISLSSALSQILLLSSHSSLIPASPIQIRIITVFRGGASE
jgi:hypothetical protein